MLVPAVTAFRCRPAKEMSWSTNLYIKLSLAQDVGGACTHPSLPRSQMKFFRAASENPCADQLKLGLRL